MAAAAAALASGAMTPNGDIDYKKVQQHLNLNLRPLNGHFSIVSARLAVGG